MRKFLLMIVAAVLTTTGAFAEQPRRQKSDQATAAGKQLPLKRGTAANSCAEYGAGFVRIEGSNTCMKIGGAVSIGAGVSSGSR